MDQTPVRTEVAGGVATVTLDRPHRLNAWTAGMEAAYRTAMAEADADPAVRAIVVTGAGRAFCAGADTGALDRLAEGAAYDTGSAPPVPIPGSGRPDFAHAFSFHLGLSKPVLAAVNGAAAGVGLVLACFCDLRYAAAGAKVTTAFARLGLPAEHGLSWVLPRLVGPANAADLLLTGRILLAEEAAAMGLFNAVLPAGEVLAHTRAVAARLATEVSPRSLRVVKAQLWADLGGSLDAACTAAEDHMHAMIGG
ncbi:MAG TPA: enoyl-CoA hydratase-related protein, partial [Acidimicrobiales bacterium]